VTGPFDANRRLAEVALWLDGTARWLDDAVEPARAAALAGSRHRISLTFDREELGLLVSGLRGVARTLMGVAQPVPPSLPAPPLARRHHLRVVW
jgi:hypothetical protein